MDVNRISFIPLPTSSGYVGPARPLVARLTRTSQFGQGGNIGRGVAALATAGQFGLSANYNNAATAPSVPTSSSIASVGQSGSVGNVTPQGQSPGYVPVQNQGMGVISGAAGIISGVAAAFTQGGQPGVALGKLALFQANHRSEDGLLRLGLPIAAFLLWRSGHAELAIAASGVSAVLWGNRLGLVKL